MIRELCAGSLNDLPLPARKRVFVPKKVSAAPAPIINKDGSVVLYLEVVGCSPDGVQYKPYQTSLVPTVKVYLPVTIKAAFVLSTNPLILTPQGWYTAAKSLATASVLAGA